MIDNLILGTAMWGWTTPQERCFQLLDAYYAAGGREIDGATNYPINKDPADFRKAEQILREWIKANKVSDLEIMIKVGSVNNMRTPEHNLSKSFLLFCLDEYRSLFGTNLDTFMIHWDNRDDAAAIADSLEALAIARQEGFRIGLSGIRHPEHYQALLKESDRSVCRIQMKHNILYSDYDRYHAFHGHPRFIAYGINAGGLKLTPAAYREDSSLRARGGELDEVPGIVPRIVSFLDGLQAQQELTPPTTLNHLGMVYALGHPDIAQVLVGPSRLEQLQDSIQWARRLAAEDYQEVYQGLLQVVQDEKRN